LIPKTAVIVADTNGFPFEELRNSIQSPVWEEFRKSGVSVFYFRGEQENRFNKEIDKLSNKLRYSKFWPFQRVLDAVVLYRFNIRLPRVRQSGVNLFVSCPEGLRYLAIKDIAVMKELYNQGFEIIYKTTLSSICNHKLFIKKLSEIGSLPYYGGTVIKFGKSPFVSGANLMLNRSAIKMILDNRWKLNLGELDDVALGKLLWKEIEITEVSSLNLINTNQVFALKEREIKETFHFRCKSELVPRNDREIMETLLARMQEGLEN
jgi:hypothetical protein